MVELMAKWAEPRIREECSCAGDCGDREDGAKPVGCYGLNWTADVCGYSTLLGINRGFSDLHSSSRNLGLLLFFKGNLLHCPWGWAGVGGEGLRHSMLAVPLSCEGLNSS